MMKKTMIISLVSIFLLITGCATTPTLTSLEGMPPDAPVQKVQLKGNDCQWVPDVIQVDKGTHVILEVESIDWDYNFRMAGYNVHFPVPKGDTVTAEIYTSQAGEFEFGCYIETGLRYYWGGMVGKLVVGTAKEVTTGSSVIDEQKTIAKAYAEIKCDPCDYNIDYGDTYHPAKKGGVDEGFVKLECDPCDYNIDYGDTYHPTEK
jgi:heme/copper-type cytochrome/quinol oxidase subunit 2